MALLYFISVVSVFQRSGLGLHARLMTLLCEKKNIVAKSKEMKTGLNLAGSSTAGCGSKGLLYQ
jgi:hypothetical protein